MTQLFCVLDHKAYGASRSTMRVKGNCEGSIWLPGLDVESTPMLIVTVYTQENTLVTEASVDYYKTDEDGIVQIDFSGAYQISHAQQTFEKKVLVNLPYSLRVPLDYTVLPGDILNGAEMVSLTHYNEPGYGFTEGFYG